MAPGPVAASAAAAAAATARGPARAVLPALLALLAAGPLQAACPVPQWALDGGAEHSRWQEHNPQGRRLVKERGTLATLAVQARADCAGLAWQASLGLAQGRRGYQGQSSTGQALTTHSDIRRLQTQVQALAPLVTGWWAGAGLGGQWLWRDIASAGPVQGYPERFSQWQPLLLLAHQRAWADGLGLTAALQLGAGPGGHLAVRLPQADAARLRLGTHRHLQARLAMGGGLAGGRASAGLSAWSLALSWRAERTGAGEATPLWRAGVPVGAAAQPATRQDSLGLQATLHW